MPHIFDYGATKRQRYGADLLVPDGIRNVGVVERRIIIEALYYCSTLSSVFPFFLFSCKSAFPMTALLTWSVVASGSTI